MRRDLNIIKMSGTFVLYGYIIRYEQMFVNGFERKKTNICSQFATVPAYVPSNEIFRVFAFKYGKFLLPPPFLTVFSVSKVT